MRERERGKEGIEQVAGEGEQQRELGWEETNASSTASTHETRRRRAESTTARGGTAPAPVRAIQSASRTCLRAKAPPAPPGRAWSSATARPKPGGAASYTARVKSVYPCASPPTPPEGEARRETRPTTGSAPWTLRRIAQTGLVEGALRGGGWGGRRRVSGGRRERGGASRQREQSVGNARVDATGAPLLLLGAGRRGSAAARRRGRGAAGARRRGARARTGARCRRGLHLSGLRIGLGSGRRDV
jgi:hypothetical protein